MGKIDLWSGMEPDHPPATNAPSHAWPIFQAACQHQPLPLYLVLVVRAGSLLQPVGFPAPSPDPVRVSHVWWVPTPHQRGDHQSPCLPTLTPCQPPYVTSMMFSASLYPSFTFATNVFGFQQVSRGHWFQSELGPRARFSTEPSSELGQGG